MRFKSWADQIGHSVVNGSPLLQHFFERSCVAWAQRRGNGPRKLVSPFAVIYSSEYIEIIFDLNEPVDRPSPLSIFFIPHSRNGKVNV